jgi:prepilin-type N-terminal cleavage/methylation domain-containing protein
MKHALHIGQRYRKSRRSRGESGFTLIEVLVVLVVTVIGLLGLLAMHNATLKGNRDSARAAEATSIVQQTMEELRTLSVNAGTDSITNRYGPLPLQDVQLDTIIGRAGITYRRVFSAQQTASNSLLRIRVVVSWSDSGDDPAVVDDQERHDIALEMLRTMEEAL